MKKDHYTKRKCEGCGEECYTPGFEEACDGCNFHEAVIEGQDLLDMLEQERGRSAELVEGIEAVRAGNARLIEDLVERRKRGPTPFLDSGLAHAQAERRRLNTLFQPLLDRARGVKS